MKTIEEMYQERIAAMTPAERIERMANLYSWARDVIARGITEELGEMPAEELKWRVAMRIYGRNPESRKLIQRMLDRVTG